MGAVMDIDENGFCVLIKFDATLSMKTYVHPKVTIPLHIRFWGCYNREEIDIFSRPDDSIPPGIESDFDSEEEQDNLLNDDPIPEYERLTFIMDPDVPVINNVDELNEDECFDPGGGEIIVEDDDSFTFVIRTFLPFLTYPEVSPLFSSSKNEKTIFDPNIST
ncbi:hypothetical protein Tco_0199270 [Tanacetum coccineum]